MKQYSAQIRHSYETIVRMFRVQEDTFRFGRKMAMALCGLLLTVLGAWNLSSAAGLAFALVGCWLLVSLNYPAKSQAQSVKEALGGQYPTNRYEFCDGHFVLLAQNQDIVDYGKLVRLVEDEGFCYLFISDHACYMLEKASLGAQLEDFRAFMAEETGLTWTRPYRLATFNLKSMIEMIRSGRGGKERKPEKKPKKKSGV